MSRRSVEVVETRWTSDVALPDEDARRSRLLALLFSSRNGEREADGQGEGDSATKERAA
jgi:hypothetical protein